MHISSRPLRVFVLIVAILNVTLAELVESVEWDGMEGTFVTSIMDIFKLNDITVRA